MKVNIDEVAIPTYPDYHCKFGTALVRDAWCSNGLGGCDWIYQFNALAVRFGDVLCFQVWVSSWKSRQKEQIRPFPILNSTRCEGAVVHTDPRTDRRKQNELANHSRPLAR
jgi:hypothetical protein